MADCLVVGFGSGIWGTTPWGGSLDPDPGGPLPVVAPFDIYCVGPCGPMSALLTHLEVTAIGDGGQFIIDGPSLDLKIGSGAPYVTTQAQLQIDTGVPGAFTLEFTAAFTKLPNNFSDLVHNHIFVGTSDSQGNSAGLFFSKSGLIYTGAVHVDGLGDLVLDSPTQALPNSQLLVEEGTYFSVRIATDYASARTYIYVTRTSELNLTGHQLRYVLPSILSATAAVVPPDQTLLAVRGTDAQPSELFLDSICLGTGLVIPNIPPRADAGVDQAAQTCTILLLDGSRSYDPEGAALNYAWRLLDAPTGSQYIFDGADGHTFPLPVPTGFTDRLYSISLGDAHAVDPLLPEDVLVLAGLPHNVSGVGTDGGGFFVRIHGYELPDNLSTNQYFKLLRQRALASRDEVRATFYPDIPGLYRFDLIVFDGGLFSLPSVTIANITESAVPRGCTPDVHFLWSYLSDFWGLVEDKGRIDSYWTGLAQIAGAELLTLWQVEYNKSLRDIQRTFQRKWLRYDLLMQEDPFFVERTTARAPYGGLESNNIPASGVSGVNGQTIVLGLPTGVNFTVTISGAGLLSPSRLANQISGQLQSVSTDFSVVVILSTSGTLARLRIDAPFKFTISPLSTFSSVYPVGTNQIPRGSGGSFVGTRSYKVERSLQGVDVQEGDFLVLNGVAYTISRVVSDASDTFPSQRLTTVEDLPAATPPDWAIAGQATSPTLDFWSGLVTSDDVATFEVVRISDGQLAYVDLRALGASEGSPRVLPVDTTDLGFFLSQPSVYLVYLTRVLRRKYTPIDPLVVDIPLLQENIKVKTDSEVLRRNVDFFIETFRGGNAIRFVVGALDVWQHELPPNRMWAEVSYLDNRPTIEGNFGLPASFTLDDLSVLPSTADYLSTVRGLWYSYFNGPTLFNLRIGTQILLGLPFAEEAGTIEEIRNDFSTTSGRLLVRDRDNTSVVRSYTYPGALDVETNPTTGAPYAVGDSVAQFTPLVKGVEVLDYIKDPAWFHGYIEQGSFYEVEKFFKFLVRVDAAAFDLSALLFVRSFILRIKPTYTFPLFVVRTDSSEAEVSTTDISTYSGTLNLWAGPWFNSTLGVAQMFDQPNQAGGGWRNHYDDVDAIYGVTTWGYDDGLLAPEDLLLPKLSTILVAPTIPPVDSIFQFDHKVYTTSFGVAGHNIVHVPQTTTAIKLYIGEPLAIGGPLNLTDIELVIDGDPGQVFNYELVIVVDGVPTASLTFTKTAAGTEVFSATGAPYISIPAGVSSVRFYIRTVGSVPSNPLWHSVIIVLGIAVDWAFDTALPAGTYSSYRTM